VQDYNDDVFKSNCQMMQQKNFATSFNWSDTQSKAPKYT